MARDNPSRLIGHGPCAVGPDGTSPLHPLAQLAVIVTSEVGAVADGNGLTPMQARMLGVLTQGPRRMADLGQGLGVEKAALTGLVDRARARGLVTRQGVPGDRRSIQVAITDDGAAAADAFYTQLNDALDAMIAELPAPDQGPYSAWTRQIIAARAARGRVGPQSC